MPLLLLTTSRPGYQPPWLRHSAATQLALPRLSPYDSLAVLRSVPQAAQLPVPVHQEIVAKAVGNPFFVEELTWAAMAHSDNAGTVPLPDTVEAVLAARIDRLPPEAKRLVQIAAVIGPEVPVPLVHRLAGLPADPLPRAPAPPPAVQPLLRRRVNTLQVLHRWHEGLSLTGVPEHVPQQRKGARLALLRVEGGQRRQVHGHIQALT